MRCRSILWTRIIGRDTAAVYQNEADVGRALRESGVPREEVTSFAARRQACLLASHVSDVLSRASRWQVWITTKLFNDDQGYESALLAAENSLKQLGLDYVDLYIL